jgi:hypothetical protein
MISSMPRMHVDELDIDEELAHRLVAKRQTAEAISKVRFKWCVPGSRD